MTATRATPPAVFRYLRRNCGTAGLRCQSGEVTQDTPTSGVGRPPRRSVYAHVDHPAARRATEPHAGGQRPGWRPMVDLADFPRRHAALAVEISVLGANGGAHRWAHRRYPGPPAGPAI